MALQVRRLDAADWERLRDLRLRALSDSPMAFCSTLAREQVFEPGEWRSRAARPVTVVASRDGEDVGMAGVFEDDGEWCVMGMWVAPEARGTGVVEALVDACVEHVRAAGVPRVHLWVRVGNDRGRRTYERLGFTDTGQRQSDGTHQELLMVREGLLGSGEQPGADSRGSVFTT